MDKQRRNKILLICAAIFIGSYVARYFILTAMRMAYSQHAPQKPKPKPTHTENPELSGLAADAAALCNLSGVWEGRGPFKDRGSCDLRLELKQTEPGHYSGDSRFSCINLAPASPNVMSMINRVNIDAEIMTGKVEKGSIRFQVDKTIGAALDGCAVTEMTVTPFGASGIAAEWKEGTCAGGNLLMTRDLR
jgi:hypothetical protein